MGGKGEKDTIDCSGAVCKVLKISNPEVNNSAAHFYDKSTEVADPRDGDIITFRSEGDNVDHIGFLVIDKKTKEKFIAESSSSFNGPRIVPFKQRIEFLEKNAKSKGKKLEYSIRRLK